MTTTNSDLSDFELKFSTQHPEGETILKLLKSANAKPIFFRPIRQHAPPGSWVIHTRLHHRLEDHFGINRACLVFCAPTRDLQPRDVERIVSLIRDAGSQVEPDISILITNDPSSREKVADWAFERKMGIIVIPAHANELEEAMSGENGFMALRNLIDGWISSHNLYDERDPVTGDRFYGRGVILRDLERKLAQGRGHSGLFGLRRIGKTSVMLELRDRLSRRQGILPVFIDLETTQGVGHAAQRIGQALITTLAAATRMTPKQAQLATGIPDQWAPMSESELIARVTDALRNALQDGSLKDTHLILMLDELEILIPSTKEPQQHAVDLFRALRGVSQETQRLTLVVAGVNADPTEAPLLGGVDNPLFGLISTEYLGPLEAAECQEMIRKVGRRMQIKWDGPAAMRIAEFVGSHPLLARLAASDVVDQFPERPLRPNLVQTESVLEEFHIRRSRIFEQMTISLRRYYKDEWDVLKVMASGDQVFASELLDEDPTVTNHLAGYGVIDRETLSIKSPAFRKWLRLSNVDNSSED